MENIKKHSDLLMISVLGVLVLVFALFMGTLMGPEMARGAQEGSSTAWATIGSMYTCDVVGTQIAFQTIDNTAVFSQDSTLGSASTTILVTANDLIYLKVYDTASTTAGGMWGATTTDANNNRGFLGSADDTCTWTNPAAVTCSDTANLTAGNEGYGLRVSTTSDGAGATTTLSFRYGVSNQDVNDVNYVGGLEPSFTNAVSIASTVDNSVANDRQIEVNYRVAVNTDTPAGDYKSTVNYLCTVSP